MAAAGKHYTLMTEAELSDMPVRSLLRDPKHGAFFVWATCPRLDLAIRVIQQWGLCYRGVAFVWVKTKQGTVIPIGAQGIPPTGTKPTSELCLLATVQRAGRPFPLLNAAVKQILFSPPDDSDSDSDSADAVLPEASGLPVLAPRHGGGRGRHSAKPPEVRERIVQLYGDRPRIELFAREKAPGWDAFGNDAALT